LANIAIIPGTVLFVFVGASAGCIANNMTNDTGTVVTIIAFAAGAVFAVVAIFLTSFYARRELNRRVATREEDRDSGDLEEGEEETSKSSELSIEIDA
jgi:uncharacterized membrane protein YeaQ/YmgE (transglycosylase-associated protein family)